MTNREMAETANERCKSLSARMLMEPNSGIVQSKAAWRADWKETDPALWGGPYFEDAGLIEVVQDASGQWVEREVADAADGTL